MKNRHLFFFILFSISIQPFGQIGIGTDKVHNKALLQVVSDEDKKGVIITQSNDITEFPLYNPNAPDGFDDDESLTGAIQYSKATKSYYRYDGTTWNDFYNPEDISYSRYVGKQGDQETITCAIFICGGNHTIKFRGDDGSIINDVNILANSDKSEFTILEDGTYTINVKVMGYITSVVSGIKTYVALQVNTGSGWKDLSKQYYITSSWLGIGAGRAGVSIKTLQRFENNTQLRVRFGIDYSAAVGYKTEWFESDGDRIHSEIIFEKLNNY